jgi:hypothetical protein
VVDYLLLLLHHMELAEVLEEQVVLLVPWAELEQVPQ